MLVLSRKTGDCIKLGEEIEITFIKVKGNRVKLGIKASPDIIIARQENPPPLLPTPKRDSIKGSKAKKITGG